MLSRLPYSAFSWERGVRNGSSQPGVLSRLRATFKVKQQRHQTFFEISDLEVGKLGGLSKLLIIVSPAPFRDLGRCVDHSTLVLFSAARIAKSV